MINIVNEAINRKLKSISFTNIITGKVISVKPLEIKINDRIVIGQSFIEPMSLGLNDYSPNSALPLIVGETVQMVRYNNGQRFYVLGKTGSVKPEELEVDYTQLKNIPKLITAVEVPLEPCEEPIKNEVVLHKISKSGSYNDLVDKPSFAKVATSGSYNDLSNKPNLATVATSGKYSDLSGLPTIPTVPTLATVATSGKYSDLSGLPDLSVYVKLSGAQTISGVKTFSALPVSSVTPTSNTQLVNKSYVDTNFLKYTVVETY